MDHGLLYLSRLIFVYLFRDIFVHILIIFILILYKDDSILVYSIESVLVPFVNNVYILTQLAQSVERQPFKLVVEGSSPSLGGLFSTLAQRKRVRLIT